MNERTLLQELSTTSENLAVAQGGGLISSHERLFMTLAAIRVATGDFSHTNKLGEGGFGAVYKVIYNPLKPLFSGHGSHYFWNLYYYCRVFYQMVMK